MWKTWYIDLLVATHGGLYAFLFIYNVVYLKNIELDILYYFLAPYVGYTILAFYFLTLVVSNGKERKLIISANLAIYASAILIMDVFFIKYIGNSIKIISYIFLLIAIILYVSSTVEEEVDKIIAIFYMFCVIMLVTLYIVEIWFPVHIVYSFIAINIIIFNKFTPLNDKVNQKKVALPTMISA